MRVLTAIATALLLVCSASASAEMNMKPGLWETSFEMSGGAMEEAMAELREQLQGMPPEQREMMERMMASQGVGLDMMSGTLQVCVTEEEAARGYVPQHDDDCQHQIQEQTGNSIKMSFSCDGDPPHSGEGEVTFHSPTSYSGKYRVNMNMQGQQEEMAMEQTGRWLSEDCGAIRPAGG